MSDAVLPISVIIPTKDRITFLERTLKSVAQQTVFPFEIIIISASYSDHESHILSSIQDLPSSIIYREAINIGAASQRNEGLALATQPFICFMDDDIYLEKDCLLLLWKAINSNQDIGGVNALITNQQYSFPGLISRIVYRLLDDKNCKGNYQGKIIGPAVNFLTHETNAEALIRTDWLNTTMTLYRREALPPQLFDDFFTGYSFMEDLALSYSISKKYTLYNVRDARIFHDSQPADYKSNPYKMGLMQTRNRYYVMTKVLGKKSLKNKLGFYLYLSFVSVSMLAFSISWKDKIGFNRGVIVALFRY